MFTWKTWKFCLKYCEYCIKLFDLYLLFIFLNFFERKKFIIKTFTAPENKIIEKKNQICK